MNLLFWGSCGENVINGTIVGNCVPAFIDFSSHSLDPTPLDIVGQTSGSRLGWPILHGRARAENANP
jgi:hypothetical protein